MRQHSAHERSAESRRRVGRDDRPAPLVAQARRAAEAALQEQRGNEARERAALRTILDTKMRGLVAELGRGLGELPPGVRPDAVP